MSDGYQIPRLVGMIVPQGNRWTLDLQIAQGLGNNYKGDLQLEAVGLPRGVTAAREDDTLVPSIGAILSQRSVWVAAFGGFLLRVPP